MCVYTRAKTRFTFGNENTNLTDPADQTVNGPNDAKMSRFYAKNFDVSP